MSAASDPASLFLAVTPSDTAKLTPYTVGNGIKLPRCRALYIGVTGDVVVKNEAGTSVTFTAVPVGILPVSTDQVLSTGTTATNIVALF